jgi:ectoine hydroxylase-related dioxygenase (phytanoyl-CoA dioxygenase family)
MPTLLDAAQLAQFAEQGYLVLPEVFDATEVARMRAEADRILELVINSSLALGRTSGRLDLAQDESGRQMVRKIQPINDLSLYLSEVAADERLLGPMRELMGDEPVLMEEKLNYKEPLPEPLPGLRPARADTHFPVHSDWAHYQTQNYPQSVISSAVTMDDCTPESGPLRVWPGSHTAHLEHERLPDGNIQVRPELIDLQGGQDLLAPAGSVMLFHVLLVHNSRSNGSGRPRRLTIYSHFPQSAGIGFDVRNGRRRFLESPFEWEYAARLLRGEAAATFRAPSL